MSAQWYDKTTAGGRQGLVICEQTGANVAVTYDAKDARLIAAAPDLLDALRRCARYIENGEDTAEFFACREAWRNAIEKATQS